MKCNLIRESGSFKGLVMMIFLSFWVTYIAAQFIIIHPVQLKLMNFQNVLIMLLPKKSMGFYFFYFFKTKFKKVFQQCY